MSGLKRFFEIYPDVANAARPLGVCIDDLVYANGISGIDPVTGEAPASLAAQTQLCLDHLRTLVESAGGSIDNIGRAVAYVTKVEDRDPVYAPWNAMFPDPNDRPAFKVLVGALPPGQLIQLDGLAILDKRRMRVDLDGVHATDPTVCIGDWLFTSRVHGLRPHEGVPDDQEEEAIQNFENFEALLEKSGFGHSDVAQITLFGNSDAYFDLAQRAYERVFPDSRTRPTMHKLISFISPRFKISAEMIAVKGTSNPQVAFQEIYLRPDCRAIPDGARIGPLLIAPGLTAADPTTGNVIQGDASSQILTALANMNAFLKAAGGTTDSLARVTIYMPNVDDRTVLNSVWSSTFPDPTHRPPHKYAPAELPKGHEVRLQLLALPGAVRQTLEIPGLKHMDPMAMGARTGNLVTSSRLFGTRAFTGERAKDATEATAIVFDHARTLLKQAGGDWAQIAQITAFIGDPAYRELVSAEWEKISGQNEHPSRLNFVESRWAGAGVPRIEIVAIL